MNLLHKLKENALSVVPIMAIVLILHLTVAPIGNEAIIRFMIGGVLVIVGLSLFLLGAEIGIIPIGETMGAKLSEKGNLFLLILFGFLIGFGVTIAEPDLQVLATQVDDVSAGEVSRTLLIMAVSAGAGICVVVGLMRTVFKVPLRRILWILYAMVFALAIFTSPTFLSVAFDAGGVTTGPMTVPFLLAFGVGIAAVRGGHQGQEDSFGMVALMSVGPILAVLILGVFFR